MAYTTIDDPSANFQTTIYTGNGDSQDITNGGNSDLQPDLLWIKQRSSGGNVSSHVIKDSNRGVTKEIYPNATTAEGTSSLIDGFLTDGFSINNTANEHYNYNNGLYVAWQWKCNAGTTSTNSDGTVNTTMQLNSTAGFSIITWTGAGNNTSTAGHGLGAIPDCIIVKGREANANWSVAFPKFETSKLLGLNLTSAFFSASGLSSYNTSTFVDGSGSSSEDYIAYCFKAVPGYSQFGQYEGNGNANGPCIYTGFKPALVITKPSDQTGNWNINDAARSPSNVVDERIKINSTDDESDSDALDFLSNGFKIRMDGTSYNQDANTYTYMAFAESPFVSSEGVPTTAR